MSKKLQPVVFLPNKDVSAVCRIYRLALPDVLLDALVPLNRDRSRFPEKNIPIRSLNATVQALFPEIIQVEKGAYKKGSNWLLAGEQIDVSRLREVLLAWFRVEFDRVRDNEQFSFVENCLQKEPLRWMGEEIDLNLFETAENGTALPQGSYFLAIPDYICQRLSQKPVSFQFGNEFRQVYRCGEGELVTWPPFVYKSGAVSWYYSLVLKFSVETIPFFESPLVLMNVLTRRWVSKSVCYGDGINLPKDNGTTVFLSLPAYWTQQDEKLCFTKARLQANYRLEEKAEWGDRVSEIMNKLSWPAKLPAIRELLDTPEKFLSSNHSAKAAIVFDTSMVDISHRTGTGTSLGEKRNIFNQIADHLPELQPFPILDRCKKKVAKNLLRRPWKEVDAVERRRALGDILGPEIQIEIRYDSEIIRRTLKETTVNVFGFSNVKENSEIYKTPEITMRVKEEQLGYLGQGLEKKTGSYQRVKDIGNDFGPVHVPTGVFVELRGKKAWKAGEDPKFAMRKGLAETGRLSQFILPPEDVKPANKKKNDSLDSRAENAVLDLLRQFGYMPEEFKLAVTGNKNFPNSLAVFGFWLIRQNESWGKMHQNYFPVVVYLHTESREVKVKYPHSNGWQPYHQALLMMSKLHHASQVKFTQECVQNFIKEVWRDHISKAGPALVLVESKNMRSCWQWLQNQFISTGNLWISKQDQASPLNNLTGIRLVRIRTEEEVPSGYGMENDEFGFTSGLFEVTSRVFWGIAEKPTTMINIPSEVFKILRTEKPGKLFKQPRLVEITPVLLQPDDDPAEWAMLVHRMRQMLPYYDDYAVLPAPLHLLKKMEEYLYAVED